MIVKPIEDDINAELTRHRFTVDEFLRMAEVGLLSEDDSVELIWGEIFEMSPINVAHALCVNRLNAQLSAKLAGQAIVSVQNPIQLDEYSLPQPDIALWGLAPDAYRNRLAGPGEVLLLIEVADSSIRHDRDTKARLYGAAGIADYWIVNLPELRIEVYREPQPDGYRTTTRYAPGETLSPLAFADLRLGVDEILGTEG